MSDSPELSVIIPTLNEAAALPLLLRDLAAQQSISLQIIVADGGSTDGTTRALDGVELVKSEAGRGTQMNAGAARAAAPWLLFLHADSRLTGPLHLRQALDVMHSQTNSRSAGHFALQFARTDHRHEFAWRFLEAKTRLNRPNTTNGDQGVLLSAEYFRKLGGFDESLPFFEDQTLAESIRNDGNWLTLPGPLRTSGRRFEQEGFHRRYFLMTLMMLAREIGLTEFFKRAPGVYQSQNHTSALSLAPFIALLWRLSGASGSRWQLIRRGGQFGAENLWQLFLWIDIFSGRPTQPALNLHDRRLTSLQTSPAIQLVLGLVGTLWIFGIMWPWFWLNDPGTSQPTA